MIRRIQNVCPRRKKGNQQTGNWWKGIFYKSFTIWFDNLEEINVGHFRHKQIQHPTHLLDHKTFQSTLISISFHSMPICIYIYVLLRLSALRFNMSLIGNRGSRCVWWWGPDLPDKSQVFLVYIGKKQLDPPPPLHGLYFSWTPWNLVWLESPRDFSKAWTSQQTLPGNWLNSLLYSITLWTNPRGWGGTLMRPSQGFWGTGKKGHLFQGNKGQILRGTEEQKKYFGTGNIRKQIFRFFGNRGTSQFISREQGNRYPLGGPL